MGSFPIRAPMCASLPQVIEGIFKGWIHSCLEFDSASRESRGEPVTFLRYAASTAILLTMICYAAPEGKADTTPLEANVRERAAYVEAKLIAWQRDIHQHAELDDQEPRTAQLVSDHLLSLGLGVHTGIA